MAPLEASLMLAKAEVALARAENRVINARIDAGRNPYYRFSDSGPIEGLMRAPW